MDISRMNINAFKYRYFINNAGERNSSQLNIKIVENPNKSEILAVVYYKYLVICNLYVTDLWQMVIDY